MRTLLALLAIVFTTHAADGPWDLASHLSVTEKGGLHSTSEQMELRVGDAIPVAPTPGDPTPIPAK